MQKNKLHTLALYRIELKRHDAITLFNDGIDGKTSRIHNCPYTLVCGTGSVEYTGYRGIIKAGSYA